MIVGDFNFDLLKMKDDARVTEYYTTMVGVVLLTGWGSIDENPLIFRLTRVTHSNGTHIDQIWFSFAVRNVCFWSCSV